MKFPKSHTLKEIAKIIDCQYIGNDDFPVLGMNEIHVVAAGDIVFVEVPDKGKVVEQNGQAAVVESTKAASDVYSPISGEVIETNN